MPAASPSRSPPAPATLDRLRTCIAPLEQRGHGGASPDGFLGTSSWASPGVLPFGIPVLDARLPGGGLRLGAVHELQGAGPDVETAAAPARFAAAVLARRPGPVLWVGRRSGVTGCGVTGCGVTGHGLLGAGLDPGRVMFADAGREVLGVAEEALRVPGLAGVVAELDGVPGAVASRRLQLAAGGSAVLGLLIRRSRRFDDPALSQPSAAETRWRIGAVPSLAALPAAPSVPGLGRALWRLDLLRCRGAEAAGWIVEAADAQGRLALASVLADGAAARPRRRATG